MTAKEIQTRIGTLHWKLNFNGFCQEILGTAPRFGDPWQDEMWQAFDELAKSIARFDSEKLGRILGEEAPNV